MLVTMKEMLQDAKKNHYAIPAFDVSNYEMMKAVLDTCEEERSPALLMMLGVDLGGKGLCSLAEWPLWDEAKTVDSTVEVAVQVNGKVRATIELPLNCPAADAIATAKANEKIVPFIEGKTVIKEISIPNKIINIVVK